MPAKLTPRTRALAVDIGCALRTARERAGMSQRELAGVVGMTRSNVARLEHGRTNVTIDTLLRLANALARDVKVALPKRVE